MRIIAIFFITVGIIFNANGQKVKIVTKKSFLAIEQYEVLKTKKKVRNGSYLKKMKLDDRTLIKGNYKEDKKIGIWEYYNFRNKELEQKYDYDNRLIVYSEPTIFDKTPSNHFKYKGEWILEKLDSIPMVVGGLSDLKLRLSELAYNKSASPNFPTAGIAIFSFIITKEGITKDYKILNSSGNSFENDLLNLLIEYKDLWAPGVYKGELAETEFLLPMNITYKENTAVSKRYSINFHRTF